MLIEQRVIGVGDLGELHHAGIVDKHVDAAKGGLRRIEHAAHGVGIADISLGGKRPSAGRLDPARHRLRGFGVAGVVDHDGEAVLCKAFGHRGADPAGGTRYQCYFLGFVRHFVLLLICGLAAG